MQSVLKGLFKYRIITMLSVFIILFPNISHTREDIQNFSASSNEFIANTPHCLNIYDINKLVLKSYGAHNICGFFYSNVSPSFPDRDCYSGEYDYKPPMLEYPKGSKINYLYRASIWIGGVIDRDTIVSAYWTYDIYSNEPSEYKSNLVSSDIYSIDAVSELDIISFSADTFSNDSNPWGHNVGGHPKTLKTQLTKKSLVWSHEYAEDMILFDVSVKNINQKTIHDFFFGVEFYTHTGFTDEENYPPYRDELSGYINRSEPDINCNISDTFNLVWSADNDGDPVNNQYTNEILFNGERYIKSCRDICALFFLDDRADQSSNKHKLSFNWWNHYPLIIPQKNISFRDLSDGFYDHPDADKYRYHQLSNGEIDYDQAYLSKILLTDDVWIYPPQEYAEGITTGSNTISLLSTGPFELDPGETISFPIALVMGEDFHTNPQNILSLPEFPDVYYAGVDFSDLLENAKWAKWIYDNPGVDTDGDGYAGEQTICVYDSILTDTGWVINSADTIYSTGDGIPDWKAAGPPQPPLVWLEPKENSVRVRFNGSHSEIEPDIFSQQIDFEGYNIYIGRDERETSLSLVASFDKKNYDKYVWQDKTKKFKLLDIPFTVEQLRCLYSRKENPCQDSSFSPEQYNSRSTALIHPDFPDSIFYFKPHSYNASEFTVSTPISKVYPNALDPRGVPSENLTDEYYTDDGYYKFFEYEYTIENLLPTIDYWISVTAFDFGSPKSGLKPLESSKVNEIKSAFPLGANNSNENKQVYIYPNPYRIDADYRGQGFEGRTEEDRPDYRVREIHFRNLPPKCTISIFSLDGDLVREFIHDFDESDPNYEHDSWNMITRNTEMVVSGLYYWVIEFQDGSIQMGKLVIIM